MAFQFPWTNFHELNLDWFLSKFKQFTDNYLGTTATAESVPYTDAPSVTVTGGELDDDTDIVDPFTFNFKIPAGQPGAQGEQGVPGVPGQDGFSPIATVTKSGGVATITITDKNGTSTTTISDGTVSIDQLNTKAPAIIPTVSGSLANFSDGADNLPMSELMVVITANQSGSGDPAPDNIRPITGWTGAIVTRTGKNLWSFSTSYSPTGYQVFLNNTPFDLKAGTYTFSAVPNIASDNIVLYGNHADGSRTQLARLQASTNRSSMTSTITKDVVSLFFASNGAGTISDIQLEYGSTATAFESYQSNTITVDWTANAGTVYGGTIDVRTGVLTVDRGFVTLNGDYAYQANGQTSITTRAFININGKANGTANFISDRFAVMAISDAVGKVSGRPGSNGVEFYLPHDVANTAPAIQAWFANNPTQLCYELSTPLTYQLTPQQLFNTLYGINNVWSDTGDSTVTYTADTMLYIQNLTAPTDADMIADQAIANGKFFTVGNTLFKSTTAIASGAKIIPGTNATQYSLADALNSL